MYDKSKRLMRKHEVLEITGLESNSTLYYLINKGVFPSPVKLSARSVAWRESEVIDWIDSREKTLVGEKS